MTYDARSVLRELFWRRKSRNSVAAMLDRKHAPLGAPWSVPSLATPLPLTPADCGAPRHAVGNSETPCGRMNSAIAKANRRRGGKPISGV